MNRIIDIAVLLGVDEKTCCLWEYRQMNHLVEIAIGNRSGIERLGRRHLGRAADGDDLFQEVCIGCLEVDRATMIKNPRAFVFGMARKICGRLLRRSGVRKCAELGEDLVATKDGLNPTYARADVNERRRRVRNTLAALDEDGHRLIRLRFFDDLSFGEIASRTGEPIETWRTRYKRTKEELLAIHLAQRIAARNPKRS